MTRAARSPIRRLKQAGADMDAIDDAGLTPLAYAIRGNKLAIIRVSPRII